LLDRLGFVWYGGGAGIGLYCFIAGYADYAGLTRFGIRIGGMVGAEIGQVFGGAAVFAQQAGLVAAEESEIRRGGGERGQARVVDGGAYDLVEDGDLDRLGAT
jgi:hypothetical protein